MEYGKVHTDGSRSGGQKPMDIVERVARAIYSERSAAEPEVASHFWESESVDLRNWYSTLARAALAAMLEAVGEPVEVRCPLCDGHGEGSTPDSDCPRCKGDGHLFLHSLAALREEL